MYNNFSSKKTKKVISALLASALVVTSAPITANAATKKVVGVGKTITYNAKAKVKSVKAAKKGIVKATKKGKKVTIKGVKAGATTVTVKTSKKTIKLNVKVGATKFTKKALKSTMTAGDSQTVSVTATGGKGDTIKFASSNKTVLTVDKASAKANKKTGIAKMDVNAVKEGTATLTVSSKNTGVKKAFKITVKAAAPAPTQAPSVATTPAITTPTATPVVATTPAVQTTAPAGTDAAPSQDPNATKDPNSTVDPNATQNPDATKDPNATQDPNVTQNPDGTQAPDATQVPDATQAPVPTQTPDVPTSSAVTGSVIGVKSVNTQGTEGDLNAVTVNGTIKILFSEKVALSSVNSANIKVYAADTNKAVSIPSSDITVDADGKTVNVNLTSAGLDKGVTYKIVTTNIKTAAGGNVTDSTTEFTIAATSVISSIELGEKTKIYVVKLGDRYATKAAADEQTASDWSADPEDAHDFGSATAATAALSGTIVNQSASVASDYTFSGAIDGSEEIQYNMKSGKRLITITYDTLLDKTTVDNTNITITNKTTGTQIPFTPNYYTSGSKGVITLTTTTAFSDKNQYEIKLTNIKTALGVIAEEYVHNFTVAANPTLSGTNTFRTIDNCVIYDGVNSADKIWPSLTSGLKENYGATDQYYAGLQIVVTLQNGLDASTVADNVRLVEKDTQNIIASTITYNAEAKTITIVPTNNLKETTDYQIQFLGALKSSEGLYLKASKKTEVVSAYTQSFTTLDNTAPTVVSITSLNGDTALDETAMQTFEIELSEELTLTANNTLLLESDQDAVTVGSEALSTKYTIAKKDGSSNVYILKIKADGLEKDKSYKLRVIGKDMEGSNLVTANTKAVTVDNYRNSLKKTASFAFSTSDEDTVKPVVNNVYKDLTITGVDTVTYDADSIVTAPTNITDSNTFTFEFSEEIDDTSIGTVALYKNVNGAWVPSDDMDVNSVTPVKNAKTGKYTGVQVGFTTAPVDGKYRVQFANGAVKDKAKTQNLMDEYTFDFVATEGDDEEAKIKVLYGTQANGVFSGIEVDKTNNADLTVDKKIFVLFDEDEIFNVSKDNFKLYDASGEVVDGTLKELDSSYALGQGAPFNDAKNTVYEFTPAKDLAYGSSYTVVVSGLKDLYGNEIAQKAAGFKTISENVKVVSSSIKDNAVDVDRQATIKLELNREIDTTVDATDHTGTAHKTAGTKNLSGNTYANEMLYVELSDGTNKYTNTGFLDNKDCIDDGATPDTDDATAAAGTLSVSIDKKDISIKFTDATKLDANKAYTLKIGTRYLKDVNKYDETKDVKTINFTTGLKATDDVKPSVLTVGGKTITSSIVNDTVAKAAHSTPIEVAYSEDIDISNADVKLYSLAGEVKEIGILPIDLKTGDKTIFEITTAETLAASAKYKLVITGVKDAAGNAADDLTVYFTTGA